MTHRRSLEIPMRKPTERRLTAIALVVCTAALADRIRAQDLTQWRGPNRDGSVASFTEPAAWPDELVQRWKAEVGTGYATPLLVGDRIYLFSRIGGDEVMSALDAATGKVLWQTRYTVSFTMHTATTRHNQGPKSTPVYSNGRLYSIGMTGVITAYEAATGKQIWQK